MNSPILLLALIALLLAFTPPQAGAQQLGRLVVDNRDGAQIAAIQRSGGTRLLDYGAFSLWQVANGSADLETIHLPDAARSTRGPRIAGRSSGPDLWVVQFIGPILPSWIDLLVRQGLRPIAYLPNNAYVVWGDRDGASLLANSVVAYTGDFPASARLHLTGAIRTVDAVVAIATTSRTPTTIAAIAGRGPLIRPATESGALTTIAVRLPAADLPLLASWPDVFSIERLAVPKKRDERQDQIISGNIVITGGVTVPVAPGYLAWLASKGFPTTPSSYPIVDVVDDGVDQGNASNVLHPDFHELGIAANPDRVNAIVNCTTNPSGNGIAGHGNLNAGIVIGYNDTLTDAGGYRRGLGVSPYGTINSTKIFRNDGTYDISLCSSTNNGVVGTTIATGATISSDSWGDDTNGAYSTDDADYDRLTRDASTSLPGLQPMLHVFAAGNAGPTTSTAGSPGNAKNVLTVGASENVRDQDVNDGCRVNYANNADDIAPFSSRGPTTDGRAKPDLVAPGTHVAGPASKDPGYDGTGVCGADNPRSPYYPPGQITYTWSSGTSHSTPAVAGGAQLTANYYTRILSPTASASPAMLKALLINSARYLTGVAANDTLPSRTQGWGELNLGTLFDGTPRLVYDQDALFTASGQSRTINAQVVDPTKPLRVSLVWTDPAGSPGCAICLVNDLDLDVTVNGVPYHGNVFSGQYSTTGGVADSRNSVENVFLPAGSSGVIAVTITAKNIAGDALLAGIPRQDYALVITNATVSATPATATPTAIPSATSTASPTGTPTPTLAPSLPTPTPTQTPTLVPGTRRSTYLPYVLR